MRYYTHNIKTIATKLASKIKEAEVFETPFKHLVVDDFLPTELVNQCYAEFPLENSDMWEVSDDEVEIKSRSQYGCEFDFPLSITVAVRVLNSAPILYAMSEAMNIPKLIPDPYFTGGGLNLMKPGGLLDVHIDGNYHDVMGLNRRLNAILFLTPQWDKSLGGEFGLYDNEGDKLVKTIEPTFNRLVIFDTHDKSFHGIPTTINFTRRSLILYYYTVAPREIVSVADPHSALWKKKMFHDKKGNKTK